MEHAINYIPQNAQQELDAQDETGGIADAQPRRKGRPRSENSRRAILEATRRLLSHTSVQKISIESISKKAGVGKTTIYRWWPNKASVVMEAVFSQPGFHNILPSNLSASDGVQAQLDKLIRQLSGKNGRIVAELLSESHTDPQSMRAFTDNFLKSRYDALSAYLISGRENGEFRADIDIDEAIDLLIGPVFFRLLTGQALDEDFIYKFMNMALHALRTPGI